MKLYSIIALMIFITNGYSQDINTPINTDHKKGEFFFAWGYNWSWYSNSDIKFEGENYNFELKSVEATDRQTPFTFEKYFRFNSITIPQYNLRLGYYFKTNYSVSIGIDHMKYVARSGQAVKISGIIENSGTIYDGVYNNKTVLLEEFFLEFEHTDGLNYINAEIRRFDDLFALHKIIK